MLGVSRLTVAGVGTVGFFGGIITERYKKYAQVNAAGAFSDSGGGGVIPIDADPSATKPRLSRSSQVKFSFL